MVKWGVLATGKIAEMFCRAITMTENAQLVAVASRNLDKAESFGKKHGAKRFYGSYNEMCNDSEVDIVYIATPNDSHLSLVTLMLNADKNVLCEKPLGVNAKQSMQMVALAKHKNLFLMEAMWTWFFPSILKAKQWLDNGEIGTPQMLSATFGINSGTKWKQGKALCGGTLLDVGIYPLALALFMFGFNYQSITGRAVKNAQDVDGINAFILQYPDKLAVLSSALQQPLKNQVYIEGTKGRIHLDDNWWHGDCATLTLGVGGRAEEKKPDKVFSKPHDDLGYQYECAHACECIEKGLTESPIVTYEASVTLAKAMDELRKQFGVVYSVD